jgi:hypothetical protein
MTVTRSSSTRACAARDVSADATVVYGAAR